MLCLNGCSLIDIIWVSSSRVSVFQCKPHHCFLAGKLSLNEKKGQVYHNITIQITIDHFFSARCDSCQRAAVICLACGLMYLCYFDEPPAPVLLHVEVEPLALNLKHLGRQLLLLRLLTWNQNLFRYTIRLYIVIVVFFTLRWGCNDAS